jgi:hypothetical protein
MTYNANKEKMLCHMVLRDDLAKKVSCTAGSAFWRAFISEKREGGEIFAEFRFKYEDGRRNWFRINPKPGTTDDKEAIIAHLRCGLENVIKMALKAFGIPPGEVANAVECYYPPDDGGDPMKTILWLEERDLIEVTVERADGEKGNFS